MPLYFSLKQYFQEKFGQPVSKISLDAGLSCPNRDGTISRRGCIFCNQKGSGTGAAGRGLDIETQVKDGLARQKKRASIFMAYFQSFTNTYAQTDYLKTIWDQALVHPQIIGLSVGTRPDCLNPDVVALLKNYAKDHEVWLELGLQSSSDKTLKLINRGHNTRAFEDAVAMARRQGIKILAHVIVGLPGESEIDIKNTAEFISKLELDGVKIHSLYVEKGTQLAQMYDRGQYDFMTQERFVDLAVKTIELLPAKMVVHRLTGDPNPGTLIGPNWSLKKSRTIEMVRRGLEDMGTWQGKRIGAAQPFGT